LYHSLPWHSKLIDKRGRIATLTTGEDPTLASHNIRQESSPTLQNSCALLTQITNNKCISENQGKTAPTVPVQYKYKKDMRFRK